MLHELKTGTGEELTPARVAQVRCPVSAIVGSDTQAMFADATRRLNEMLPQMRVARVAGAGHLLPMTHAAEFARLIAEA
jgi:pimeloyl-ACP methyl ester carboxylesterase